MVVIHPELEAPTSRFVKSRRGALKCRQRPLHIQTLTVRRPWVVCLYQHNCKFLSDRGSDMSSVESYHMAVTLLSMPVCVALLVYDLST